MPCTHTWYTYIHSYTLATQERIYTYYTHSYINTYRKYNRAWQVFHRLQTCGLKLFLVQLFSEVECSLNASIVLYKCFRSNINLYSKIQDRLQSSLIMWKTKKITKKPNQYVGLGTQWRNFLWWRWRQDTITFESGSECHHHFLKTESYLWRRH